MTWSTNTRPHQSPWERLPLSGRFSRAGQPSRPGLRDQRQATCASTRTRTRVPPSTHSPDLPAPSVAAAIGIGGSGDGTSTYAGRPDESINAKAPHSAVLESGLAADS
jgi:hypothetical protein